jgi:aspartate-semialdehyde dehydrogenase
MDTDVPLVVPEVNPEAAFGHSGIIANPNCSTILLAVAAWPLHKHVAPISRIVCSTYQAASGAGAAAMAELEQQARDWVSGSDITQDIFQRQYVWNLFSHNSPIDSTTGYNEEELKMIRETRKIFNEPALHTTATCIRVPVLRAHCEAINISFAHPVPDLEVVARQALSSAPGLRIVDDRGTNTFPEPLAASDQDDVLVGRIRSDLSAPLDTGLELFIAGDQIRKGAATNAVQIAELFLER